jgi:transcriptional regulator with XRE-family HTH domain
VVNSVVLRGRFGERVKTIIDAAGLSTIDLADRSELPVERIENILTGRFFDITLRDMTIIAHVLGSPLYNLLAPLDMMCIEALEIVEER